MARKNASADTTRAELLDAAAALLAEQGFDATVHLRLTDVTRRAGRTTGAAYQVWPRQRHFHRDLALFVARTAPRTAEAEPTARVAAQARDWRFAAFLHACAAARGDRELREVVRNEQDHDQEAATVALLAAVERVPRQPWSAADVSVAIGAVVDGFTLRRGLDAGLDPALVTAAVDAVLTAITEPAPGSPRLSPR